MAKSQLTSEFSLLRRDSPIGIRDRTDLKVGDAQATREESWSQSGLVDDKAVIFG